MDRNMFRKMLPCIRMVQRIFLISCVILLLNGMINGAALAADRNVIIGFHQSNVTEQEKLVKDNGGKLKKTFHLVTAISAILSDENISKLKQDPGVAYIENDSIYQAADEYTSSWGVTHIGSQAVHDQGIYGAGVKIAVLDTGIDYNHEDLKDNYKVGYDFVFNDADPLDDSTGSHGTHVSGIIAAQKNGIGVIGVSPNANIYAVKVLDGAGFGTASWIIAGLQWAVDNNMTIATMSLEGPDSITLHDAVDIAYNSGVLLVAAGGNTYGASVSYPGAYDSVIAVSATDANDNRASFSSVGPEIELAAPGVNVYSTVRGGYAYLSGTSMAAPHVTGAAALIYSTNFPDVNGDGLRNNKDVRELLHNAKDLGSAGKDNTFGYGLVDASMSVPGIPAPQPPNPPAVSTINLTLKRISISPADDIQKVNLSKGNYSININNVNLTEVDMKVYENGVLLKRLSRDLKFNSKKNNIDFNLTVNNVLVTFTPNGKRGSTGYITIKSL